MSDRKLLSLWRGGLSISTLADMAQVTDGRIKERLRLLRRVLGVDEVPLRAPGNPCGRRRRVDPAAVRWL